MGPLGLEPGPGRTQDSAAPESAVLLGEPAYCEPNSAMRFPAALLYGSMFLAAAGAEPDPSRRKRLQPHRLRLPPARDTGKGRLLRGGNVTVRRSKETSVRPSARGAHLRLRVAALLQGAASLSSTTKRSAASSAAKSSGIGAVELPSTVEYC